MRPKGGKYPGISAGVDRSLGDADNAENGCDAADLELHTGSFWSFDGRAVLEAEASQQSNPGLAHHSVWMDLGDGKSAHKKTILCTKPHGHADSSKTPGH